VKRGAPDVTAVEGRVARLERSLTLLNGARGHDSERKQNADESTGGGAQSASGEHQGRNPRPALK
jgi:hypothetical protein